jgi:iron complex transport system substrate-binding protein
VSANLCSDRLVLALADADKVISVGRFAADPAMSTMSERAAHLPLNRGDAEEIAAMRPDLVIMGTYTSRAAAMMLQNLGISVYKLPVPKSLDEMRQAIRDLAARLGESERGEKMIADFDQRFAALIRPRAPVRVALYTAGGWSHGAGTIADDILKQLGARNITAEMGVQGGGTLPLESLIAADPQVIVVESSGSNQPSIAAQLLEHPVLSHRTRKRVELPMRFWACADPALVEAAQLIADALP